eukprot:8317680-Heterocapsa_arctica.AAC.1
MSGVTLPPRLARNAATSEPLNAASSKAKSGTSHRRTAGPGDPAFSPQRRRPSTPAASLLE